MNEELWKGAVVTYLFYLNVCLEELAISLHTYLSPCVIYEPSNCIYDLITLYFIVLIIRLYK
jgi:hypothetical protein